MSERPGSGELFPFESALRGLRERFADALLDADRVSLREHIAVVRAERLPEIAAAVHRDWGGALVTLVGLDERAAHGRFRLHAVFSMAPEDALLTLAVAIPGDAPRYPSLTPAVPAAHWLERELQDLLGLVPEGHPDPRPLVAHDSWPRDAHPLRHDFDPSGAWSWAPRFAFHPVEGEGVFEIPVGPIHAGIIEPGHFRFSSVGESVLKLDLRLGWTYRGLETLARGASVTRGLELAEHTCGLCALSNALAYCMAVEELTDTTVPPRARALRSLAGELERLYNHAGTIGHMLNSIAFVVGAAEAYRLKEMLQQVNDALFGHRFLRGACVPGGVARDLGEEHQHWLRGVLATVRADLDALTRSVLASAAVLERLAGAGSLTRAVALDMGAVGPGARASGIARDVRRDHPYAYYRDLDFQVPAREEGDALARFRQHVDEMHESLTIVEQMLLRLPGGPLAQHLGGLPEGRWGIGLVESPRGRVAHWVRAGARGALDEWRVRSASHADWPAVAIAMLGAVVPDFPLVNKSFNLCYACVDR